MIVELAAQMPGQIFILKCNANTLWKLTQTGESYRLTISYLQGYSCPKLQLQETEKSETYGEYSSQYKKNNFNLNAGKMNDYLFIKVTMYLAFSFRKNLNKAGYSIYEKLLPVFSNEGTRLEEK